MTKYHVLAYIPLEPGAKGEQVVSEEYDTYHEARRLANQLFLLTGVRTIFVERQKPCGQWQILLADDSGDDA